MELKGCYIVEMQEKHACTAVIGRACANLESDPEIIAAAQARKKYSKSDAWWSIPAGMMLVAAFALYSFRLTIASLAVIGVMAVYLAAMFIRMVVKRSYLKKIDNEISPQRAIEALFRRAMRLPARGRDISRLVTGEDTEVFSASFLGTLVAKSRECGVEPENWEIAVKTDLTGMVNTARDAFSLPVRAEITSHGAGGRCSFVVEYMATFAAASTGDCLPVDIAPVIAMCTPVRYTNRAISPFKKCACGTFQSEEALKTREGVCRSCGQPV